ncbi:MULTISPECIES: LysE/ArgO family amino acid transporter [Cryobacterium]|uniref:Amino acid transporter n=1 Tax=Cryobacterium zongtaii TaxID=1259217 RepID=A0A2S3ZA79_9MICO|nr:MULTISPECIES: LysE family transporter [Cryobacterium]POH62372.1 amino acid transporter [Cryobacterium zongtaii]POH66132.1 amino acid transporter [Cryobacterium zongtaii]TFC46804.1 amino acid transporter [Cryobacterium sp. TMN-39-2]TFC51020.1 amino acid transporter [Cryobacterium sp. TMB3-1-2]TFC57570.1 amino acid transporter [Cryobacterium sp. TMB1-7]
MTPATTLLPALLGLVTGLSLIIAIGAQNAFVLRLGIEGRTRVIAPVVAIAALSDAALILAGVLGMGALVAAAPAVMVVVRLVGAAFLVGYGLWAARRAIRPGALLVTGSSGSTGMRVAVGTVLALTWLNPHVYLDTVVFLGAVASQQDPAERWWWAGGAITASILWFTGLGFGARLLRPIFARPGAWRVLDGAIAVLMLALGARLAFDL